MKAAYTRYILDFKVPGGTSRGILTQKETWFVRIWHDETPWIFGIGECALFRGLSADDRPGYEEKLKEMLKRQREINQKLNMDEKEKSAIIIDEEENEPDEYNAEIGEEFEWEEEVYE